MWGSDNSYEVIVKVENQSGYYVTQTITVTVLSTNILINNLISCWKFDETSGTSFTDSMTGGGNTLTGTNVTVNQTGLFGSGKCVRLTGTNSYMSRANVDCVNLRLTTGWSIATWIKPVTLNADNVIISKMDIWTGLNGFCLYVKNTGQVCLDMGNESTYYAGGNNVLGGSIAAGSTYHIVVTFSGTEARLYINGAFVNIQSYDFTPTATGFDFVIGQDAGGRGLGFNGYIDETDIYGAVLTESQVALLYTKEYPFV